MSKPKVSKSVNKLYASRVNKAGLYSEVPIVVFYDEADDRYKDDTGMEVHKNGLDLSGGYVTYASQNEAEIYSFIYGASAVIQMLEDFMKFKNLEEAK